MAQIEQQSQPVSGDHSLRVRGANLTARVSAQEGSLPWVVFVGTHGQPGSHSPLSTIQKKFQRQGHPTIAIDLVASAEVDDPLVHFDIPSLAERLAGVLDWIPSIGRGTRAVHVIAEGNAAAVALWHSTESPLQVASITSVNGRPHLAEPRLGKIDCPTMLVILGEDARLVNTNQQASRRLAGPHQLKVFESVSQKRAQRKQLSCVGEECLNWIRSYSPSDEPREAEVVGPGNWAFRLGRQFLTAFAFLSVTLAVPQPAATFDSIDLSDADSEKQNASQSEQQ